jgi:diacylglycerol kinase
MALQPLAREEQPPVSPGPVGPARSLSRSFGHAVDGLLDAGRERNFRIHLAVASAVFGAAGLVPLSVAERLSLTLTVGLVLAAELFNTALEAVVDLATTTFHLQAKRAKDAAAGAVLVLAGASVLLGAGILETHLSELLPRVDAPMRLGAWCAQVGATVALLAGGAGRGVRACLLVGGLAGAWGLCRDAASPSMAVGGLVVLGIAAAIGARGAR